MFPQKEETRERYTVVVEVSFPVSGAKAREVLERWWAFKKQRKEYMRARRSGSMKGGA